MKKFMLFLAAFLMLVSPLAAGQAMSVTWEWLLDDPEVNYYRYQLDGQADDGWIVVDGTVSSYTVDGLDPYRDYTLYLQRSYDGVYWSTTAEAVAEALLVEDVPETADITPVLEEAVVEEVPVLEEPVVEVAPVLEAPKVEVLPELATAYVEETPVEDIVAIGEEIIVVDEPVLVEEEEKSISVEDIIVVEEPAPAVEEAVEEPVVVEEAPAVEEVVEETPVLEEPVVEEVAPVEEFIEETPVVEEVVEETPAEVIETPVVEEVPAVEPEPEKAAKNDFRFSLLFKGGITNPLDYSNMKAIKFAPSANFALGLDFANIIKLGNSCGLGLRTDVATTLIPNEHNWDYLKWDNFYKMGMYAYTLDPSIYLTFDAMAGIVDFTFGAGFAGGFSFPNSIRYEQFGYDKLLPIGEDFHYLMGPAALFGMRFYCGDVFSIGVEGTYRASMNDWLQHDVSANVVMGFSF